MKNPNPLMLLRIAQADAYCMATEYIRLPRDQGVYDAAREFKQYCKHPTHQLGAGMYTDDTQMSMAIAEHLISDEHHTPLNFANHFMRAFIRDKRDGYSRGFQKILEESRTGQDLLDKLIPDSSKNGAMMRAVPLGVIPDLTELLLTTSIQARVTHNTEQGVVSACATALLSHWALYSDRPFKEICEHMASMWPQYRDAFVNPWRGPVKNRTESGGYDVGINTVWAVCSLLREQPTLMGMLNQVIEWGGDTDSVAAVAWGIASTRIHDPLPAFLERDLEPNREFGPNYLRALGVQLMAKYAKSKA